MGQEEKPNSEFEPTIGEVRLRNLLESTREEIHLEAKPLAKQSLKATQNQGISLSEDNVQVIRQGSEDINDVEVIKDIMKETTLKRMK